MGEFIKVDIDLNKCMGKPDLAKWVQVCPVNIFELEDDLPMVVEENEDECTLCMLCVEVFPHEAVSIRKLYET
jgi:NAD-dependent dihydropyrimidine dehydrogenase PreA subunit